MSQFAVAIKLPQTSTCQTAVCQQPFVEAHQFEIYSFFISLCLSPLD
jgi:hypothetical protein